MNENLSSSKHRRTKSFVAALCLLASIPSWAIAGPRAIRDLRADVAGGHSTSHVLVQLTPNRAHAIKTALPQRKFGDPVAADSVALSRTMQRTLKNWGANRMRPVFSTGFAHPDLAAKYGLDRFYVIDVPQGTKTPTMAAALAGLIGDVEAADADAIGETAGVFPSDPDFSQQWSLYNTGIPDTGTPNDTCPDNVSWCAGADIDAPNAWDLTTGSSDVTIAIIDSGVYPHVEFGNRLLTGWNTVIDSTETNDGCPHGTHVAGIAAAGANNGFVACPNAVDPNAVCGTAGVNWNAKILPVKVLTGCSGDARNVAAGIQWAADQGADVLNISLQFYGLSGINFVLMENALNYALETGAVVVAAAGNGHPAGPGVAAFPGALPQAIAVSATTACDELCTFANTGWNSNYGPEVEISAPGDDIYSTWTFNSYKCLFGTSMATPHVAGVASLIRSLAPELTSTSIRNILRATSIDLGDPGWDQFYGYGRLDAYGALFEAQSWPQMLESDPPSGAIDARRPHLMNNPFAQQGWNEFDATFRGEASRLTPEDFSVEASITVPNVAGVEAVDGLAHIQLDGIIPEGRRTIIRHLSSGTSTQLGFLPGDVNGNGVTQIDDLEDLKEHIRALNSGPPGTAGVGLFLPTWSTDIDRSGETTPADIIELINLMNGAGTFEPYLGRTLSPAG